VLMSRLQIDILRSRKWSEGSTMSAIDAAAVRAPIPAALVRTSLMFRNANWPKVIDATATIVVTSSVIFTRRENRNTVFPPTRVLHSMENYTIHTYTNKPYFLISNPRNTNIVLECGNLVLGRKGGLYDHAAEDEAEVVDLGPCAHGGLYRLGGGCLCGVRWLLDGKMGRWVLLVLAQTSSQAGNLPGCLSLVSR